MWFSCDHWCLSLELSDENENYTSLSLRELYFHQMHWFCQANIFFLCYIWLFCAKENLNEYWRGHAIVVWRHAYELSSLKISQPWHCLHFGSGTSLMCGGCPIPWTMFSHIAGLATLHASGMNMFCFWSSHKI